MDYMIRKCFLRAKMIDSKDKNFPLKMFSRQLFLFVFVSCMDFGSSMRTTYT